VWRGPDERRVTARVRYRGPEQAALAANTEGMLNVRFEEPTDAPSPGQAIVCYDGDLVVGGGVIEEAS